MKLAFLEFIASGPRDALMDNDYDCLRSKAYEMRLSSYSFSGIVIAACWLNNKGSPHNPFGPAAIWMWPSGKVRTIEYHINGHVHRVGGPAIIHYDESGNITRQQNIICPWVQDNAIPRGAV